MHSLAAVFSGVPESLEMIQLRTPEPTGEQILVRVTACTLCGSDLHSYKGRRSVAVPTILGHEIVGEIVAFGPDAARTDAAGLPLEPGTRVVWSLVASCGNCFYCSRELPQKCLHSVKYGHESFCDGRELLGGLAEHCLLMPGTTIVRVPDHLPQETIAPGSCATATMVAALEAAGRIQDRSVCIAGSGLLGLTAAAMSRVSGAESVIVCDRNPDRLRLAERFGATAAVTPDQLADTVLEVTAGRGVDVALELSGASSAFQLLWSQLRTGGTLVPVGAVFPSEAIPIYPEQIVRRNLTIRGIHNYGPSHLIQAVDFLSQHHQAFPFREIVSRWYPLSESQAALQEAMNPAHIRIGVRPD